MFEERKDTLEAKYAHDQEQRFKLIVRRNKQLGLWAASLLDKEGDDADAYAMEVVKSDFEEPGEEDVVRKVAGDLSSVGVSESDVREKMETLLKEIMEAPSEGS
jgi:hypothetical protein